MNNTMTANTEMFEIVMDGIVKVSGLVDETNALNIFWHLSQNNTENDPIELFKGTFVRFNGSLANKELILSWLPNAEQEAARQSSKAQAIAFQQSVIDRMIEQLKE